MCFTVNLSEKWRRVFGLCTTVLNGVLLVLGLSLVIAGIAIRVKLDSRLELMEDYNPGALPILLIVTGVLLFLTHLVALKFCYDATYIETRSTEYHRFIALIIFMVVLCVYVFIAEIVTLVHSSKIEDALERGISNLMRAYISDLESKVRIDVLQLEFTCCGANSYEDWFGVAWINLAYVNANSSDVRPFMKDGKFIKDDAPFSCCNRFSKFACVHQSVKSSTAQQVQKITLSREGCASAISNYFHERLIEPTAILILFILIFQVTAITLMRLLQTSIVSAAELGDPEADGAAYCLQSMGVGKDNRSYYKTKAKKDAEGGGNDGDDDDDDSDDEGLDGLEMEDEEGGRPSGIGKVFDKMKTGIKKPKLPWKRKKGGDGDSDDGGDDGGKQKKSKKDDDKERKKKEKEEKRKGKKEHKAEAKQAKKDKKSEDKKKKKEKKAQKAKEKSTKKKEKDLKKKKKKEEKKAKAQAKKQKKKAKKEAKKAKKKNKKKKKK